MHRRARYFEWFMMLFSIIFWLSISLSLLAGALRGHALGWVLFIVVAVGGTIMFSCYYIGTMRRQRIRKANRKTV